MKWRALAVVVFALFACKEQLGDRCDSDTACDEVDGGYCAKVQVCTRDCTADAWCPQGSVCRTYGPRQVCLRTCSGDGDCHPDEACTAGACVVKDPFKPPY